MLTKDIRICANIFYMKALKDYEKDLNKCSKCGLCEVACPLFKLNPNDCVASKGKFIMLHGVTKGELELSPKINSYIDMCLKCEKCNVFCPSGIDVCSILNTAKYEYTKNTFNGKLIHLLFSRPIFRTFIKICEGISKPFRPKIKKKNNEQKTTVAYFKGCVNQIFPNTDKYLAKIFKNSDIEIVTPDFDCCGLPFLSEGEMERFIQGAKYNIAQLNFKYDYLIADCASCQSTISEYSKYIEDINFDNKIHNWGDLIALKNLKFKFRKPVKITFHKPCHLKNDNFFKRIIDSCENVEYIEMEGYDDCCGFAGSFGIKNRELSKQLSQIKAKNIAKTNADYVITTCPACILGLKQGLFLEKNRTKVISLLEFLSMADEISS